LLRLVATNGIIHTLSGVLLPPDVELLADAYGTVELESEFSDYLSLLTVAGDSYREILQTPPPASYTLVASKNTGFASRPTGELPYVLSDPSMASSAVEYNVVEGAFTIDDLRGMDVLGNMIVSTTGNAVFLDGVEVIGEELSTNGMVLEVSRPVYPSTMSLPTVNVLDVARDNGFTLFCDLFESAGLTSQVAGDGPFTVFAVTDDVLLEAVQADQSLLQEDGTPSDRLRQILLNHVAVPPQLSLLGDSSVFYKGTSSGITCEGLSLDLGGLLGDGDGDGALITLLDICLPFSIDTLQGSSIGAVSDSGALLPCLLTEPDCLDIERLPALLNASFIPDPDGGPGTFPNADRYFISCALGSGCIDLETGEFDLLNCVACGSYANFFLLGLCIATAGDEIEAILQCVIQNTQLDPDWLDFFNTLQTCTQDDAKCGSKELYVSPNDPAAQWTGLDASFDFDIISIILDLLLPTAAQTHIKRHLQNNNDTIVEFTELTNVPAANGVLHEVTGVLLPTFTNATSPRGTEAVSDEAYAWIALGATVGVLVSGMALYQRHQMKKTPLYDAEGYDDEQPKAGGLNKPLIEKEDADTEKAVADDRF